MDPQRNAERFLAEVEEVPEGVRPVPQRETKEEEKPRCEVCRWYRPVSISGGREIPCTFHVRPPFSLRKFPPP